MTLTAYNRFVALGSNTAPVVQTTSQQDPLPIVGTVNGQVVGYDADGDPLTYSVSLANQGSKGLVIIDPVTGKYSYTPYTLGLTDIQDSFTVTIDDSLGMRNHPLGQHTTTVTIEVSIPGIIGNQAPVFDTQPSITSTNNTTGVLTGTFKAHDPEGAKLSFVGLGLLGTVDVDDEPDADGNYTFTYTPYLPHAATGLNLTDLVTITASDPSLALASATFTVHLSNNVNQTPQATYQNTGGSSLLGTVTGSITVTDDDILHTYTPAIITTGKGSVLVSALTGDYVYTASLSAREAASASGATSADKTDTFTVTVTDPYGASTDVVVTVTIPTINIAPIGGVPSNTLGDNNGVVRGQVTAVINTDGDPLSYSIKGSDGASTAYTGAGAIVHVDAAGNYTYIPPASSSGVIADSFTIVVSDGRGGTSDVLVAVGVLGLTSPLKNVNVTKTNSAVGTVTGSVGLASANNGLFTYSANGADYGTVTFDGTNYTYVRTATGHTGGTDDTFDIIGTAYGLQVVVATVTVTPTMANSAPTAGTTTITSSSLTNVLGVYWQSTHGKVNAADADGDTVNYPGGSIIPATYSTTNGGTVSFYSDGTFDYTIGKFSSYYHAASAAGASGNTVADTFTITVTDGFGGTSNIVVSIPIEKLNTNPKSSASVSSSTDTLGVVRGTITGDDDDNDSLTYSLSGAGNPAGATATSSYTTNGGIVTISGNTFVYIPTKSASTTDTFKVVVSDGHGGTSVATISVGQATPSPTTVVTSGTNTVTVKLDVPAADASLLTLTKGSDGTKGTVVRNADGTYTYTRNNGLGHSTTPNDSFTIIGTDANGRQVTIATVNVAPPVANAAPAIGAVTVSTSSLDSVNLGFTKRQTTTGSIAATDADGDTITFTAGSYSTANGGTLVLNANGTFSYTIDKGSTTSYYHEAAKIGAVGNTVADSVSVTATDAFGGTSSKTISVPIYAENDAPSTPTSGVFWGLGANDWTSVFATDGNGDSLTYTITKQPQHGSASYNQGLQTLNTTGAQNNDTITLTVTDGYYVVVNGVVTGTPASSSRTYTV